MNYQSYDMELDEVYYNKLRNADFIEIDGMIFIKDHLKDLEHHIKNLQTKRIKEAEIEQRLNHVMMEFVSTFYKKQEGLAINIIKNWKKTLKKAFPNKKFVIEIIDEGGEYVIYLYTHREDNRESTISVNDKTHKIVSREIV